MNITSAAIKNSRITVMGVLISLIMGITTYLSYPSAEDPTIVIRNVIITANYPGMSAERVENLITIPLEDKLRSIAEIDDINSTSRTGNAYVEVTIHDWVTELDPVFQDIRNKMNDVKTELPDNTQGPFVNDEFGLTAISTIALWADGFSLQEMHEVSKDMQRRLYTLDGLRRVELYGVQEERIYLDMDTAEIANLGLSPEIVFRELIQQNIIKPGGALRVEGKRIIIEPSGAFENLQQVKDVVYKIPDTDRIARLGDVVEVTREFVDPPIRPVFFNGRQAIIISVSTVEGTNNVEFGDRLTQFITDFQNELPIGYALEYATFQPEIIDASVNDAASNVYQTLIIVLLVVLMFLGVRTGLIVGSFVPLTMTLGILIMSMLEIELQRMSIAAMIIALGLLVDNGIVVAEDIRVRMGAGMDKAGAAIKAGNSLAVPLLISSLTTICAFLPMMLLEGSAGEYVKSLSQVVAVLLLVSWLLSMTVTPAMSVWFMQPPTQAEIDGNSYDGIMYMLYRKVLYWIMRFRLAFLAILILLFVGSIQLLGTVKTEFFPLGERNQFLVYIDFESGTEITEVEEKLQPLFRWLRDEEVNPEIESHIAYLGGGGPRFFLALSPIDADPHRAFLVVNTKSPDDVRPLVKRINDHLLNTLPEANGTAKQMWFGGSETGLLEVKLIGPDSDKLLELSKEVTNALHQVKGTSGIQQDWENKVLKIYVNVDQARARRAGITSSDIADVLVTSFDGYKLGNYLERDESIPIVLRAEKGVRSNFSGLDKVRIYAPNEGEPISLNQVASLDATWEFAKLKREDQQRTLIVQGLNAELSASALLAAIQPSLDALNLPAGYQLEIGGELADQAKANEKLFELLPLALAAVVVLLVGQFNSFRRGAIIMATIPLMMIGGVLGLVIMNAPYGFMVLLGFFSLAGILINNGIVLIDRIETEREDGKEMLDAILTACQARLRPILMTMLTTVLGLVPLILFGGALFYGMASVIAIGLICSTVITLGFVPVLYSLLFRVDCNNNLLKLNLLK
ncbi:MMPL family transporter [Sneathiella sp. P13V-1]|uniref:efflux RND transporter permease subunit n=1 Tax=Sneathiella sp. P13V-1 TaxID=2697366 RepID=UPI00187B4914|nr:efflux RND transporter permease subunit [Sneathiella sp. P13V-1]MBE7637073.1 MMPL family transporter [Sneathiella sp. P13V-1]